MEERYVKSFINSGSVFTALVDGTLNNPYVAYVENETKIDWNSNSIDPSKTPFTLYAITSGTIPYHHNMSKSIRCAINGVEMRISTDYVFNVNAGDKINIFCELNDGTADNYSKSFSGNSGTAKFYAYGNMTSLLNEMFFQFRYPSEQQLNSVFSEMFRGNPNLLSVRNLYCPETYTKTFYRTFRDCIGLKDMMKIDMYYGKEQNFYEMYRGCTSLTGEFVPSTQFMPANGYRCFTQMFYGCGFSSIKVIIWPPSANNSYVCQSMFGGNRNLTKAEINSPFGMNNYDGNFSGILNGCAATGTLKTNGGADFANEILPSGWTLEQ